MIRLIYISKQRLLLDTILNKESTSGEVGEEDAYVSEGVANRMKIKIRRTASQEVEKTAYEV